MNVAHNLETAAFHFPERIAVIEGDRKISFAEFDRDTNRIAASMVAAGVQPGHHLALCAPNSYRWLVFYFGALKAGAVAATFSHLLMKDELLKILEDCRPKVTFAADDKLDDLKKCRIPGCPELIVSDSETFPTPVLQKEDLQGFEPFNGTGTTQLPSFIRAEPREPRRTLC
jgi:long-chain acyl-CoA synthetase